MPSVLAHNNVPARRFLTTFKSAFTTRSDGSTWPNWERTWIHADQYFRALLRPGKRKSITGLASRVGADQERLERFVRESAWEPAAVQDQLRATVPDAVNGPDAAIIVDGMGIPKQGHHSVGVGSQWCGATTSVDNCQVAINCTLARPGADRNADQRTWPLGSRLYLPKEWTGDDETVYDSQQQREQYAQRRADAAIPSDISHQPKYDIAADLIERALDTDIEHACVLGDANFGRRSSFRQRLRELGEPYVLALETGGLHMVAESAPVLEPGPTDKRGPPRQYHTVPDDIDPEPSVEIADQLEDDDWTDVTWSEGTRGDLTGSFYRKRVRVCTDAYFGRVGEETGWLLLQRDHHSGTNDGDGELAAWLCWGLDESSLDDLVEWAHLRWTIEQYHRDIKQVLGADEFQGRTWRGFHHHMAVVMLTQAFVAIHRLETGGANGGFDSFEEVTRQLVRIAAIQRLMDEHGLDRATAETIGTDMLRGFSEWS